MALNLGIAVDLCTAHMLMLVSVTLTLKTFLKRLKGSSNLLFLFIGRRVYWWTRIKDRGLDLPRLFTCTYTRRSEKERGVAGGGGGGGERERRQVFFDVSAV